LSDQKKYPTAFGINTYFIDGNRPNMANTSWVIVSFGEQGMGLLPATLGTGST
jgi:hypothetical protein